MPSNNGFSRKDYFIVGIILTGFLLIYIPLLTNNDSIVDGSVRGLEVYWNDKPVIHENNHLLYTINVYAWSKITNIFASNSKNAFDFLKRIQLMNAISASVCLALSYLILFKFLKRRMISLCLVLLLGFSNAFFRHAISGAETMSGFLFFVISLFILLRQEKINFPIVLLSAFFAAYSVMSYLSMLFGIPLLCAVILFKNNKEKHLLSFFVFLLLFIGIMYLCVAAYKGTDISHVLSNNEWSDSSYEGFKLKNLPKYPFGLVNGFVNIDNNYDLPTYVASVRQFNLNSIASIFAGFLIMLLFLFLFYKTNLFSLLKQDIKHGNFSIRMVILVYFLASSLVIIYYNPVYDKLWIMGMHSLIVLLGLLFICKKEVRYAGCVLFLLILIVACVNTKFAVDSKSFSKEQTCVKETLPSMDKSYILLNTWNAPTGVIFFNFYFNRDAIYLSLPNLALENGLNTSKAINVIKKAYCAKNVTLYATSDVMMSKELWNTFLGDELKMDYVMFHKYLLYNESKLSDCLYTIKPNICKTMKDDNS